MLNGLVSKIKIIHKRIYLETGNEGYSDKYYWHIKEFPALLLPSIRDISLFIEKTLSFIKIIHDIERYFKCLWQ
jgi:hypothetical protein